MRHILALSVSTAALVAVASLAHAQAAANTASSPDIAGESAANAVEAVVVVANRTPERLDKVGQSVTVLTLPQLRADQETTVSDILDRTPGVVVTRSGGVGEPTALNIRGADSDQTVVLVDGVKQDDPSSTSGAFSFDNLVTGDISRVEILRGPQSTLYGSQAIGGVVNIVTADPTRPFQGDAQIEGGSYGTLYAKAAFGGRDGALTWRLAGDAYTTNGVSAFDEKFGGREPDGYRNQGVSGRLGYDFTPDVSLDLRGAFVNARSAFDGFSTATFTLGDDSEYGTIQQASAYSGLNFNLLDARLKNRLALEYTQTAHDDFDPSQIFLKTFGGLGETFRAEYQGVFAIIPGWQGTFGASHERSTIAAISPSAVFPTPPVFGAASIDSGYGQIQAEVLRGLNLTGGVRYDSHSTFGGHTTGQAAAAWSLNDGATVLRASWGQGFKAPSLYQLHSPYGNVTLDPEQSNGWDAGVQQRLWDDRIDLQATYFHRDTTNLIAFNICTSNLDPKCTLGLFGYYKNIQSSVASGVELSAAVRLLRQLTLSANYTYTDATDRSAGAATFGKDLPRRPRNTANAEASYVWPFKLTTGLAVRYAGSSFDDAANSILLKSYTLVDLRLSYPLPHGLEVYGRIENLTDRAYETTYQYGNLGRAGYIGVRAVF